MTGIDIQSAALLARQRDVDLRRVTESRRLVREARSAARFVAAAVPSSAPVMHAWLSLAAGQRATGA